MIERTDRTLRGGARAVEAGGERAGPPVSIAVRRLLREIGVPLLLLCALDLGLRWYVARTPDLPLPNLLSSPVASGKYLAYRRLVADDRPLEVLLMGQSQMMRANTSIVLETVAHATGRHVLGFNFAAPLQSIEFDRRLLEDVLVPIKPPRTVVLGLLPQNLLFEQSSEVVDRNTRNLQAFGMHAGTPEALLRDQLFRYSELFRHREVIHDALLGGPPQIPFWVHLGHSVDRYGDVPLSVPVRPVRGLNLWERRMIKQFAKFDEVMAKTPLFEHIRKLARTCRAHGIQLVLLNNALHPLGLQVLAHGEEDLARFIAAVHATADAEGVPVLDLVPGGIGPPEMFADIAHPNVDGIRWISERIGRFLIERGRLDGAQAAPAANP